MGGDRLRLSRAVVALGVPSAVLVTLVLVLVLSRTDRIRYRLPELPLLDATHVHTVVVRQPEETITLTRGDMGWKIEEAGKDADEALVQEAIAAVAELRLTDLVSAGDAPARYQLDSASRLEVTLVTPSVTRTVWIGRQAITLAHTFVSLPGDRRVFHAEGTLRGLFSRSAADYRNTLVLQFDPEQVSAVEIAGPTGNYWLTQSAGVWMTGAGTAWTGAELKAAIQQAAALYAIRYAEQPPGGDPLARATFHLNDNTTRELVIYPIHQNSYPATSSDREDPFLLFTWIGDALVAALNP